LAIKKGEYLARIFPFKNPHFWRSFVPMKKKENADIASQRKGKNEEGSESAMSKGR
jgi:hypothetical protein